jgi:hypothetical protein
MPLIDNQKTQIRMMDKQLKVLQQLMIYNELEARYCYKYFN